MKKVLNVGGNNKSIPLPPLYAEFEHLLLDIDASAKPDILCDARDLSALGSEQFNAVYCSHNLEHYYRHDVPKVLAGFLHVLKADGFAHILVPDVLGAVRDALARGLDLDDVLYQSNAGPILVLDVIYGYHVQIEQSGQDYFAHKTGFTQKSLFAALKRAGFSHVYGYVAGHEIATLAFKNPPDAATRVKFGLPTDG